MTTDVAPPRPGEPSPPGQPELVDGTYALVRRLGAGGSGEVFEAVHVALGKRFALKRLHAEADAAALARFRREAAVLGRLAHPHVVGVSDFGVDASGRPYLVMELLDGVSLAERCANGALPPTEALPILGAIADALDHAHREGLLHRDLKPANVVLRTAGGQDVRVIDFGLAGLARETGAGGPAFATAAMDELTHASGFLGTLPYAAPEILRGEGATTSTDLYAFAVIAYEVLCGRRPFAGTGEEIAAGHLRGDVPDPTNVNDALPAEVGACLRAALAKSPLERPTSAGALVAALREALARTRTAQAGPRRLAVAALIAVAATVAAAGFGASPAGRALERFTEDRRIARAAPHAPDRRLLLVTLDDREGTPALGERADEVARGIAAALAAGARGVAVDVLLPARWSESGAFTALVLQERGRLVLAAASVGPGQPVLGTDCVMGLTTAALGREDAAALFGFVNLDEDEDGLVRRVRASIRDGAGELRPTWSARAARLLDERSTGDAPIDVSGDWRRLERIRWSDLAAASASGRVRDRLVLVGGDFLPAGDDRHRIPGQRGAEIVSGLVLQALSIDTLLAQRPIGRNVPPALRIGDLLFVFGMVLAVVWPGRRTRAVGMLAVPLFVAGRLALGDVCFERERTLWPVVAPAVALLVAAGVALAVRRRLDADAEDP